MGAPQAEAIRDWGSGTASIATAHIPKFTTTSARGADGILQHLDRVKRTGPGTWQARCPAHDDRGPSLSIRETDDARVLVHCFAGCSVDEVLASVGLTFSDLFPPRAIDHHLNPERRPFPAADVLRAVGFEALVVCAASSSMQSGQPLSNVDHDRLIVAASRIQAAITSAGVSS